MAPSLCDRSLFLLLCQSYNLSIIWPFQIIARMPLFLVVVLVRESLFIAFQVSQLLFEVAVLEEGIKMDLLIPRPNLDILLDKHAYLTMTR